MGLPKILEWLAKSGKAVFSPKTQARNKMYTDPGDTHVFDPATQARNLGSAKAFKHAQGIVRSAKLAQAKSLQHATAKVDDLIRQGKLPTNVKREDLIRKMQQHLEREYEIIRAMQPPIPPPSQLPGGNIDPVSALMALKYPAGNFTAFPAELIRKLGDKAVWAALGAGGVAGYGIGANEEAIKEMLKSVQLPTGIDIETTPIGDLLGGSVEEETQLGPVKGYFKDVGFGEEEGNWGKPVANLLMDIISPIPRQK